MVNVGDIVEVNGERRIVTKVLADSFATNPYTEDVPKIEKIEVSKKEVKKTRGKK